MKAYLGTSGFSYPEWKGSFYPDKLKNADMLSHYAGRLPSVELNNTFYRLPRRSVLESWHNQVHEGFRFAVKASRRITHFKKLNDAEELVEYLLGGLSALSTRLGPILFQLPPTMRADAPLLGAFLQSLPSDIQGVPLLPAFEFRHKSWFTDEIFALLEKQGATMVSGDLDESAKDPPLVRTAPFAYLRLRKTTEYTEEELDSWAARIRALKIEQIFAYFKHEEAGPDFAQRLEQKLKD